MVTSFQDPTPSFMMLCLGDFSSNLCIPTKFMTKYRQAVQHSVVLETEYSPTSWDVKIKNLSSDFYMTDGWSEFVKDNQLGELDFLTFRFMAESTFRVSIYGGDGCPKHPTPMSSRGGDVDKIENGMTKGKRGTKLYILPSFFFRLIVIMFGLIHQFWPKFVFDAYLKKEIPPSRSAHDVNESGIKRGSVRPPKRKIEGNPLCFEARMKPYHNSSISLPQAFSRAANMEMKRQVRVEFEGNRHGFCVAVYPKRRRPTIELTNGWREFREANGLVQGKTYSFEFNPDDQVIYVKEVAS
ncbi:putative B3 domain-containing protein Os03g0621600 [Salvia miltiorrhiza]|uniref:putative B3 domain-containing protein Os03g0621600 n=1 Tax=Salvia miltiorrhiza TaxID=226208 RepID=UPI0025AB972E|nr:putative B3 domain-containing protein Os03g0621600 [Salvia miltiorrhiza]